MVNRRRSAEAALLIGCCILASVLFSFDLIPFNNHEDPSLSSSSAPELRRYLMAKSERRAQRRRAQRHMASSSASTKTSRRAQRRIASSSASTSTKASTAKSSVRSWANNHLEPVTVTPDPSRETFLFWHIPKSGGTTTKAIYECLHQTLASRAGSLPRFGHDKDKEIAAFHPWRDNGPTYVNVDTSSPEGILHAEEMGLVPSGLADLIITGDPAFAIEHLYDDAHKGRVLALFRHPVDRLVSKFYYLQTADWERAYNPGWKKLSVLEFAETRNNENNVYVKNLVGKKNNEKVTEKDLKIAMKTLRERCIVGLTNEMEESIHRYNVVMDIDESDKENKKCMDRFFGDHVEKRNANPHPIEKYESPAWNALAERNELDIRLFHYVKKLFKEQKEIIESYAESLAVE